MKGTIVLLICIGLAGCSWFNSRGSCQGEDCGQTPKATSSQGESTWYCYSTPDEDEWNCQDESDPSKVLSLKQVGLKQVATRIPQANKPAARGPRHQRAKQVPAPQPLESAEQQPVSQPVESYRATQRPQQVARATPPAQLRGRPSPAATAIANQGATSILQQPAGFYTVQLIALQDESKILAYARDNGLKYPLYAQIHSQGRTLYVLLLGLYPDRLLAARAKDEWAAARHLSAKPWIRELGPLQDAIRLAVR